MAQIIWQKPGKDLQSFEFSGTLLIAFRQLQQQVGRLEYEHIIIVLDDQGRSFPSARISSTFNIVNQLIEVKIYWVKDDQQQVFIKTVYNLGEALKAFVFDHPTVQYSNLIMATRNDVRYRKQTLQTAWRAANCTTY